MILEKLFDFPLYIHLMRISLIVLFGLFLISSSVCAQKGALYEGKGDVSFISIAPVETIEATSSQLKGIINLEENTFAFSFQVSSFEGFNSPLQKEHFNEHFLETAAYPKSTFVGKMIVLSECDEGCEIEILTKGKLTIHGITKVVSIPVLFIKKGDKIEAVSQFDVLLADYNIDIPLILEAKISPVINIGVTIKFDKMDE